MNHNTLAARVRPRGAFTLIEMTIAATLLGVVFAVLGQFLVRWEAARRAAEERTFALQTLECVLERVAAQVDRQGPAADNLLPTGTDHRLRSPGLELDQSPPDDANLTAITARLIWRNAEGQQVTPVSLTTWIASASNDQTGGRGSRRAAPGQRLTTQNGLSTGPDRVPGASVATSAGAITLEASPATSDAAQQNFALPQSAGSPSGETP